MLETYFHGMLLSGSLIVAIGAQNAFLLKRSLIKTHIFWVSTLCFSCDVILMTIGVLGVGSFISANVVIQVLLALCGAVFLLWYGIKSLKSAFTPQRLSIEVSGESLSLKQVITATLMITLLNPHVYLDTVVIVGGIAGTLPNIDKIFFLLGTVTISFIWFFGVGYGGRLLLPLFNSPKTWKILDCIIGGIMLLIASQLLWFTRQLLA